MEIMGLAVIIILLALGALFVVRFVILRPTEIRQEYVMKSLAVDSVTAILRTNTDCYGYSIKDLLMDCAEMRSITCIDGSGSCTHANASISKILDQTLNKWKKNYIFTATETAPPIYFENGNCTGSREVGIQPLPTWNQMEVSLYICE